MHELNTYCGGRVLLYIVRGLLGGLRVVGREEVELAFDVLKNPVGGDCTYLCNVESVRVSFLFVFWL
jgi:hypothetical protein